jgi:glucose-1-phosphate adenylyltransferase
MGIYIFKWDLLRDALERDNKIHPDSDFGKHVLPMLLSEGRRMFAYPFNGYWKDVGTVDSYWTANMDLIQTVPDFNLYENFDKIYKGCEVLGKVYNSILGPEVIIEEGAVVRDSILMEGCYVGKNTVIERCIIDIDCTIGDGAQIGIGENIANVHRPNIYDTGITVLGEFTSIPDKVLIGKNCVVYGKTTPDDYENAKLDSGHSIVKRVNEKGVRA